nr:hypothetical protein [Tanacetum cinerariifolium]
MADKEKRSTMKGFTTNDQANYCSGVTSITVNGKNDYELKGKLLDDLYNNAFRSDEVEPTNEKTLNLEETDQDDEQEIEWPTYNWRENERKLPGANIVGNTLRYKDLEWYDALKDSKLKEEALRNKAIMEGLTNKDVKLNNKGWKSWDDFEITNCNRNEWEYENEHEDDERCKLCGNETHELPIFTIRRFKMIKYSFEQDKEYVAVKEDEYGYLTSTRKDACRAYQEIFCMMDE